LQDNEDDDRHDNNGQQQAHTDSEHRHDLFALLYSDPSLTTPDPSAMFNLESSLNIFPGDFAFGGETFDIPGHDNSLGFALPNDWSTFSNFAQSLNSFDTSTDAFWFNPN